MKTVASHTRFRLATMLIVVVACAVCAACVGTAHAQQVDESLPPFADLTITSEYDTSLDILPAWAVTVKNNTVGAHPGMHLNLVKVRITISDPVRGATTSLWTIRGLPPGGSALRTVSSLNTIPAATDEPAKVPQRLYAEIIEAAPVESPRFRFNNATEHWVLVNRHEAIYGASYRAGVNRYTTGDVAVDVASISDRFPPAAGATTFTVTAYNSLGYLAEVGAPLQDHTLFDVQVEISLSPGLSFAGTQPDAPDGTTFHTTTGIWNVGTLERVQLTGGPSLPVAVNLTAASLADLSLEERCLTAKVVRAVPWFATDWLNDTATACLGKQLLTEGEKVLLDYIDCVGVTSNPCTSADTLELVVEWRTDDYLQPEAVTVQVQDPQGRHNGKWRTGTTTHHMTSVPDIPGAQAIVSYLPRTYSQYHEAVSDVSPKQRPGTFTIFGGNTGTFKLLDADTATSTTPFNLAASTTNNPYPIILEFGALGTYKLNLTVGATHNTAGALTDTGTYTFHVGPISELGVRDAGANPEVAADRRAYTILAVNDGPDIPPAIRVTLTGVPEGAEALPSQGSYAVGSCQSGLCEGVWTIGNLRHGYAHRASVYGAEGAALTLITASGAPITATIENMQNYCVRIKTADPDPENDLECDAGSEPAGYTEHSIPYYDHVEGNNTTTVALRAGTGVGLTGAPKGVEVMETRVGNVLIWQPVKKLYRYGVTHYEAQRWASGWMPLANRVTGTVYLDREGRANADYRVRAVNEFGVPGPWSITGRPPDMPGNFTVALSESGNAAVLSWTEPASPSPITGYVIDISDSADGDSRTNDATVGDNVTTWTHTGLSPGDVKFYRVQARNRDGVGAWTEWQSVGAGPGRPGNLRAQPNGSSETVLTWNEASSRDVPIYEYELEYSDTSASDGYEWNFLQTVLPHEGLRYVDDTVVPGTTRHYRVRAWTVGHQSAAGAWSNVASATTPAAGPSPPLNVFADYEIGNTENGILLTWEAPASGDASYYRIEHSTDGGATWELESARHTGTCDVGGTTKFCYTDRGLFSGTEHWYRVAGVNISNVAGEWAMSNSHITQGQPTEPPDEPQNLRVTSVSGRQVSLAWEPPMDTGGSPVTGYEYQAQTACAHDPTEICQVLNPTRTSGTTATVTVPNVKGYYEFSVRALNAAGAGWWTQSVSQYIDPQRNWRVTVSPSSLTVPEGDEKTYRVTLTSDPRQPVMLLLWWDGDPDLGNTLSYQQFKWLLPSNYANQNPDIYLDPEWSGAWNVGVTITVTADEDTDSENGTAWIDNTVYYVPCADLGNPSGCVDNPEDTGVTAWVAVTEQDND